MRGPRPCPATAHERSASSRPALVTAHRTLSQDSFGRSHDWEQVGLIVAPQSLLQPQCSYPYGYVIFEVLQPVEFLLAVYDFNRAGYDFSMTRSTIPDQPQMVPLRVRAVLI